MANVRLSIAANNAAMDAITVLINVISAGSIKIYDGTQPANSNTAVSGQTLLGTLAWSTDAFGDAVAGVAVAATITGDTSADADGTASWARILDGGGSTIFDCDVGLVDTTIILNSVTLIVGGSIDINNFALTHPSGV